MLSKTSAFDAQIKSVDQDDRSGEFTALASVFGNIDAAGEIVMKGAFRRTLGEWKDRGDPVPIVWNHDHSDPFSHVGEVLHAAETPEGLMVTGKLDLTNPKAEQVHRLMKGRRIKSMSFAYEVRDARPSQRGNRSVKELHDLDLHEVGPVWRGCNPAAQVLDVKAEPTQPDPSEVVKGWLSCISSAPRLTPAGLIQWATELETPR